MAPQQAPGSQRGAPAQTVLDNGLGRILGTGRHETTTHWKHGGNSALVHVEEQSDHPGDHGPGRSPGMLRNASRISPVTAAMGPLRTPARPTTTSAIRDGAASRVSRYASRSRRFTLFLATAPRTCRLTVNPTRLIWSDSAHRQRTTMRGRLTRWPFRNSAWKAGLLVKRSRRGSRPAIPSVASAP
jgi:hypothetical protein